MSTVCLNMIVKDESHIILETLQNLINYINFDYWVISDTGSTDGTQDLIKEFFKKNKIDGELFEDEWIDFSTNRNKAIQYAFNKSDYLFFFDADDLIQGNFKLPNNLNKDVYKFKFSENFSYYRACLVNNRQKICNYIGVLHEILVINKSNYTSEKIEGDYYFESRRLGNRSKNINKYKDDAEILENAYFNENKNNSLKFRYAYYCAQSYRDANIVDKSIHWFKTFLDLSSDNQYKYCACINLGNLYKKNNSESSLYYYTLSYKYDSERVDGISYMMEYYYNNGFHFMVNAIWNKFKNNDFHNLNNKIFLDNDKIASFDWYNIISGYYCNDNNGAYESCKRSIKNNYNTSNVLNNLIFYKDNYINDKNNEIVTEFLLDNINDENTLNKYIEFIQGNNVNKSSNYQNSNKILIYTGCHKFLWNDNSPKNSAIGGSEKAVIYLSRNLPKNYEIYIVGDQIEGNFDNIKYIHNDNLQNLLNNNNFHTIILSRFVCFFHLFKNIKCFNLILWAHDTHFLKKNMNSNYINYVNNIIKIYNKYIDKVICLTDWHKNLFISKFNSFENKIMKINNGINIDNDIIENNITNIKIKNKFIWSSCLNRGLDNLLKLWPKILEVLPDATLDICSYDEFPKNQYEIDMKSIIDKNSSIQYLGKLNNNKLYNLMKKSEYWVYTNTFEETSCITAMEMLMCGVICLYYPLAGLNETIGEYGIKVNYENIIETIINLSNETKNKLIKNGKQYALTCSWENRTKEWNNLLDLNKDNITKNKIGIFNSFPFHYEIFGFILNYAKNNNFEVDIYTNQEYDLGWFDFYKTNFNNFNIIDFNNFYGNSNKYNTFFVTTDDDPLFKCEWITDNVICLNHYYKIRTNNFRHYLNIANFKDSILEYSYPCYPLINYKDKLQNTNVCIIGGGNIDHNYNINVINNLYSNHKIKLNIFTRKICNTTISNLDTNKFDIDFIQDIETIKMIRILKESSYVLINYNSNEDHNTGVSCSGSLQLALSTLCKPIIINTANQHLKIENALEYDINSNEPINIDGEIDFKAIELERNKYINKFESYMDVIKIKTHFNLNLNKHTFSMNDFANVINKFNLNLNNIFDIGSMNAFDADVLYHLCNVRDVHIFEAVPNYCKNIEKQYPSFKVNSCAINNYNGTVKFNIIKGNNNYGISSLRNRNKDVVKDEEEYNSIIINSLRMDKYIEDNNIESIDICKIDVEGCSYEILEGFGKYLNYIKFLHIESESIQYWENQKLTKDIFNLLQNNFIRLSNSYNSNEKQIDSIFVNKEIIKQFAIKVNNNISNIPKKIFQTWEIKNIEPEFQNIIDKWKEFNPDYEYIFHDAEQRVKFIKENFEKNVFDAYNKIIPGAYKCDLCRYCVLYIYGGFYADIDTLCMGKLNDLTCDNIDFIVPIDLNINSREGQHNLACGFIGSVPNSPILLDAINRIVFNVENNIIPTSKLDFSGPGLLGRAVNNFLKLHETSSFIGKEGIKNNINFLHFDPNNEYMTDINTDTSILQNKNGNQELIELYNNECVKIKNYSCWVSASSPLY